MTKLSKFFIMPALFAAALTAFTACESTKSEDSASTSLSQETADSSSSTGTVQFKKEMANIQLKLVSAPDAPLAKSAFAKPFVVSVKDLDGNPYSNYTLTVTAPVSKTENVVAFETTEVTTDDNGTVSFKPQTFTTSLNSSITFTPKAPSNNPQIVKLAKAVELEVPCKVKMLLPKPQTIMVNLVDYSPEDKMILSSSLSTSSNLLGEIWRAGYPYQAQNADFHKQIDLGSEAVYKEARRMTGGAPNFKYVVYGKVKYASPIAEVEGGFSLTLTSTVTVIELATGKEFYTVTKTTTVVDKNKWNVLKACQEQIAKDLANDLIYSM